MVPNIDVVKAFFDMFVIARAGTTPHTPPTRKIPEGFATPSVFNLYSSLSECSRVTSTGILVPVSAILFGRALNLGECLPAGAQALDQPFFGIVTESGDVVDKRQRKVLASGRFVSTEDELEVCMSKVVSLLTDKVVLPHSTAESHSQLWVRSTCTHKFARPLASSAPTHLAAISERVASVTDARKYLVSTIAC